MMTELEQKVDYLLRKWEEDNYFKSNINLDDSSFKALIELGSDIIPHLLSRLGESWIIPAALYQLTGENINLLPEELGHFNSINEAWLQWGKDKGIIKS